MFSLTRCGRAFRAVSIGIGASIGLLGASGIAIARDSRDSTPDAAPGSPLTITLSGADGGETGTATFSEAVGAVVIDVSVTGLEPGDHGIHSHETGTCDANGNEPVATPGFAPVRAHAGNLGNIAIGNDGTGTLTVETGMVMLAGDTESSPADADGSALVILKRADGLTTAPSGESGACIAYSVIFPLADDMRASGTPMGDLLRSTSRETRQWRRRTPSSTPQT